jgi:hypothetical protein
MTNVTQLILVSLLDGPEEMKGGNSGMRKRNAYSRFYGSFNNLWIGCSARTFICEPFI